MTTQPLHCPRTPSIPLRKLRIGGINTDVVMLRRKFSASVPVDIDECPQCGGIWLDSDELARIRD